MSNQLAIRQSDVIQSFDDVERVARAMSASGFFQDIKQASQAIVKVLAGRELGFGPFASMNGVHIIQGKPVIAANLMASAVKKSGRYDYRIREMTDVNCRIEFFQGAESLGVSTFSAEDAKRANTQNMSKFPRNMLFARAMSNGVRWYCPDVMNGSAVYTPEELGAEVNEDGEPIAVSAAPVVVEPQTTPPPSPIDMFEADFAVETQAPPPPPPQPRKPLPAGSIPQAIVEAGLAENVAAAAHIINKCKLGGLSKEATLEKVELYRKWRDAGADSDAAAENTIQGISLP